MRSKLRIIAWTDLHGVVHKVVQSAFHPMDWNLTCGSPNVHTSIRSAMNSIRREVRARKRRKPVTCLMCLGSL